MKLQLRIYACFKLSSGVLLLAFVTAVVISNISRVNLVAPQEPILGISIRSLLWIFTTLACIASILCLLQKHCLSVPLFLLWLTSLYEIYRIGFICVGGTNFSAYWADLAYAYNLPLQMTNFTIEIAALYLLIGSGVSVILLWANEKSIVQKHNSYLKIGCPACGGRIQFSVQNIGQQYECPHCQKSIILNTVKNLKMECFFCQQRIEFPPHALGHKIPCPHCKKGIMLKIPARTAF